MQGADHGVIRGNDTTDNGHDYRLPSMITREEYVLK